MTPGDEENQYSQQSDQTKFDRAGGIATPMTISRACRDETMTAEVPLKTNTSQKKKSPPSEHHLLGPNDFSSGNKKGRESATLQRRRDLEAKRASQASVGIESLVTVCEYAGT